MAEETLLSAARRAVRFFNIDEAAGSLMTPETVGAFLTLNKQIEEDERRPEEERASLELRAAALKAANLWGYDEAHGGLVTHKTVAAMQMLNNQVLMETARQASASEGTP